MYYTINTEISLICNRTFPIITEYKNTLTHSPHFTCLLKHSVCMFLYSVTMEKPLLHISEVSHITPLLQNFIVQLTLKFRFIRIEKYYF